MESYNMWSFMTGFFHLCLFTRFIHIIACVSTSFLFLQNSFAYVIHKDQYTYNTSYMCIGGMSEWEKRHLFDENIWPISACLAPSFMLSTKWQIQKIYIRVPDFVDLRASGCKWHVRGSLPLRCGHRHSHLLMDTRRWSLDFRHACVLSHV